MDSEAQARQQSLNDDPARLDGEALVARLLYRDALMLVLDKPAGIAVHRGPANREGNLLSLDALFPALRFGLPRDPALAHRLDRGTSGCLVLGRHRKALEKLGLLFKQGRIGKEYWALVEGGPAADAGEIDLPLGRRDADRGWWMKVDAAGLPSRTRWRVLGRGSGPAAGLTALALEPLTGRTHQLRVHCRSQGWPIAGDPIYGSGGGMLCLHARQVRVPLYKNRDDVVVEAPLPPHMRPGLAACGVA